VLEIAIRRSEVEAQGTILDKCSQIMAYADVEDNLCHWSNK
jgi:hypothetical protein